MTAISCQFIPPTHTQLIALYYWISLSALSLHSSEDVIQARTNRPLWQPCYFSFVHFLCFNSYLTNLPKVMPSDLSPTTENTFISENWQVLQMTFGLTNFWGYGCISISKCTSYFGTIQNADLYKLFPIHQNDTSSSPLLLVYLLNFSRLSVQTYW